MKVNPAAVAATPILARVSIVIGGSVFVSAASLFLYWFTKDVSLLTIWPKDTHRQGLGVN
jgi:hypothetical protein